MKGRWRAFRHEAGRDSGPSASAYVLLFCACLLLGHWSTASYQSVVVWLANGVMLAAYLQLRRRSAATVLLVCFALNLISSFARGDILPFVWINPVLNLAQVIIAGVLTRRFCGAALDLRRPRRVALFVIAAAIPAVAVTVTLNSAVAYIVRDYSLLGGVFVWRHLFAMELLGLVIVVSGLLLVARAHRYAGLVRTPLEILGLFAALAAVVAATFSFERPYLFLIFPPLMVIAYRLSPPWVAGALVMTMVISGTMTLAGYGPVAALPVTDVLQLRGLSTVMRQAPVYYGFMLVATVTALPLSALMAERLSLENRLARRSQIATDQRRRAEAADGAKSRFLAMISHEMLTPLNTMHGYTELLSGRDDVPKEAQAQVKAISEAGATLLVLIEDILGISVDNAVQRSEPFDLPSQIRATVRAGIDTAKAKGLRFALVTDLPATLTVQGDLLRLRAGLGEIIANAVKFTDRGSVRVEVLHDGQQLTVLVADTGVGVSADFIPRMFAPFEQNDDTRRRRYEGAGIGLASARRHARAMGGDVTLVSTSSAGSLFQFTARLKAVQSDIRSDGKQSRLDSALRVLIVDDHPVNRKLLSLMMETTGCRVSEAVDGEGAVAKAASGDFDLILMDVRMPDVDGLEATRRVRALTPPANQVAILAVTADALPEDERRCLDAGMDGHLAKPVTQLRLFAAVDLAMSTAAKRGTTVSA